MELNDFKEETEKQDTDTIKKKILTAIYDLAVQIAKHEGIEYNEEGCKHLAIKEIMEQMPSIFYANDYYVILYNKLYNQEKIQEAIDRYNRIKNSWECYLKEEKKIKEKGYENLLKIEKEKLTQLFHEMLEFKNKKYDENWDFLTLLEYTSRYYNAYSFEFDEVDVYKRQQLSIGCASSEGKAWIHSAGKSKDQYKIWDNLPEQNKFLEAMADSASSVHKLFEGRIAYINVMKNLSVDCDCCSVAEDPCMKDIGILASLDPIAIDQACIDLVYHSDDPGKNHFIERVERQNGIHTIEAAAELGFGTREYELITIE